MASISARRIANSITWSLNFTTRARTLAFSFSSTEHARSRRHHSNHHHHRRDTYSRHFSTQPYLQQDAPQPKVAPTTPKQPQSNAAPKSFVQRDPPPTTLRNEAAKDAEEPIRELTKGFSDVLPAGENSGEQVDWTRSFHGLSAQAFSREAQEVLMQPINVDDIEIKSEGLIYLPEIKYRRILNRAFGPGGWGLAPRGETIVTAKCVTREYALVVNGRLVSIARGEQDYFDKEGIPTATEGCKSNALMRCCKDLGIASELWDPRFVSKYFKEHARDIWVEHVVTKKRKKMPIRKDDEVKYPFKEIKLAPASGAF